MIPLSHFLRSSRNSAKIKGFTQIEMLVGTTLVAVLGGVLFGVCSSAMGKGTMMREIAAGKNLITAYATHAADNNGKYLPAINLLNGTTVIFKPTHKTITGMVATRYPFRLAPYFDYRLEGTILVNENRTQIEKNNPKNSSLYNYSVSVSPAFGINYIMVGGLWDEDATGSPSVAYPSECITTQTMADCSVIAFVSASYQGPDGSQTDGFHYVTPPNPPASVHGDFPASQWSTDEWSKDSDAAQYGHVDARHDGKAICTYLDGSVKAQSIEELRDMRLWSRNAHINNDPNYVVPN